MVGDLGVLTKKKKSCGLEKTIFRFRRVVTMILPSWSSKTTFF